MYLLYIQFYICSIEIDLIYNSIPRLCVKMEAKKLTISTVGDMVDTAIIHLSIHGLNRTVLQKAVFLYLLSISAANSYSFEKIADIAQFEPYKYGPFSDFIDGEVEILSGDGDLENSGNNDIIKTDKNKLSKYPVNDKEMNIINEILELTDKLNTKEFVFYVYFHPSIPKNIKKYFTQNSEIKSELIKNKEKYIKELKRKGIIDDEAADLIRYD